MTFRSIASRSVPALALTFCLASTGASYAGNLIQNGDFSSTTNGYGQLATPGHTNNTSLTGWNNAGYSFVMNASNAATGVPQGGGSLALWDSTNNGLSGPAAGPAITASPDGGNFVAIDGDYQTGALSQTLSGLNVGQVYAVSFYWGIAQQKNYNYGTWDNWDVSLSDGTHTETHSTAKATIPQHVFSGWFDKVTMYFTATSTTETLSFLAHGGYDGQTSPGSVPPFALLDGVSMEAVPEPASMALMSLGLAGATLYARLRRRTRTA